jgi:hypothetical protein
MVVRDIVGRQWHPRRRCWSIPRRCVDEAVADFAQVGLRVSLDGQTQAGAAENPFPLLQSSMDPAMWSKVSGVLAQVLDPENGGDERLHVLLRRTQKAGLFRPTRQQRAS